MAVVIALIVDLTKLVYGGLYEIPVSGEIIVPNNMLIGTDIRRISPIKVSGYMRNNEEEYQLDISVTGTMILPCARTLKDVEYPFDIQINEVIGENDDNSLEIIQNRLEIFPIIWQYILVDVPLRVLHPDAKEESIQGNGWRLITEDDKKEVIDPRLMALSEFNKE